MVKQNEGSERLKKRQKLYNILSIIIFIAVFAGATFAIGPKLILTVKEPEKFNAFIHDNLFSGVLIFLGIQILQVFFALIPGEPIELFSGYAFGWFWGTVLCLAGCLIASACVFLLTRKFGKKFTYIVFAEDKLNNLKFMQSEEKVELMMFLLFFIPGTPKDLLTYFAGLTKIDMKKFLPISTVARIPSVLTSALAGSSLMQKNYVTSAIVFGITAVISGVGILIYRLISKRRAEKIGRSATDSDEGQLSETDAAFDFDTVAMTDTADAAADTDITNTADKTDATSAADENDASGAATNTDANTDAAEGDEDRQISRSE